MITEQALKEAIAEVQGKRDPNRDDCMMLAAFYIIQDRMYPDEKPIESGYSFAAPAETERENESGTVGDYGDTEFLETVRGMDAEKAWLVLDELMETLLAINPRLYNGVIRQLNA